MSEYLPQIVARLNAERVPDLSYQSLANALTPCIGGTKLLTLAIYLRNVGELTIDQLHHLESRHDVGINVGIPEPTPPNPLDNGGIIRSVE